MRVTGLILLIIGVTALIAVKIADYVERARKYEITEISNGEYSFAIKTDSRGD